MEIGKGAREPCRTTIYKSMNINTIDGGGNRIHSKGRE